MVFVLFPNQCFDAKIISAVVTPGEKIIIWDSEIFYGDRRGSEYGPAARLKLNPLRIEYQRACVRDLAARVSAEIVGDIREGAITAFDPCDKLVEKRLKRAGIKYTFIDSPQFLATRADIDAFPVGSGAAGRPHMMHRVWYDYMKKKLGVLLDTPNLDIYNRKAVPIADQNVIEPGPELPTNPRGARAWLAKFLRERFARFGPYEDAIVHQRQYLYHSGIAPFLNNGLLTPAEVVEAALAMRDRVPIESLEGFLRQIIGWREYSRLYYLRVPPEIARGNNTRGRRPNKSWYTGRGLPVIVQETIRDAFKYGYLHHIRRLMVMSNYMTLCGLHPDAIYAWMFEFSLDSWEWVMVFNVYSMGTWTDRGVAMRKPYLSTTQYIYKISDAATRKILREDPKSAEWDQLYRNRKK